MSRYRFTILFVTLTVLLVTAPALNVIGPNLHPKLARLTVTAVFAAVLLSAVFATGRSRATVITALVLAVPTLVMQAINILSESDAIAIPTQVLGVLFIGYTVVLLLVFLFTTNRVTFDTISASLCAYLLLGVLWSIAYSLLEILAPGSFAFAFANSQTAPSLRFGGQDTIFALYYSFVTMTTLGYGDIAPATSPARMLAAFQAVIGQLYLTVLVARLVGMHISQPTQTRHETRI